MTRFIDWNKFDWQKIYQVSRDVKNSFTGKGTQFNFTRSDFLEHALEEYSDGQLMFIGEKGRDFKGIDGKFYECKTSTSANSGLFMKSGTSDITLKNHQTKQKDYIDRTFDEMILLGFKTYGDKGFAAGLASFEDVVAGAVNNHADIKIRVSNSEINFLTSDIEFSDDYEPVDMHKTYMECIRHGIRKL